MIMIGQSVTRVRMRNVSFISGWVENRQHTMAQPRKKRGFKPELLSVSKNLRRQCFGSKTKV